MVAFVCVLKRRALFRALVVIIDTKSSSTEYIKITGWTCLHKSLELGMLYRYLLLAASNHDDKFMIPDCAEQKSEEPAAH